jgi:hypothetical protein
MIRAAIEVGGTAIVLAAIGFGLIYGFYYWRKSIRALKRQEATDEKANPT